MRFFLALRLTMVLRIAHETSVPKATRIVAASTKYDPKAMCGTKSNTSTRNASRHSRRSMMLMRNTASRYLEECEGE